ncbi:DUF933 domain-containing protein [Candidatus Roizmanbacteria bacterium]|nr:DUF933 domain-containing protein [Candidatus Roizmanbacteria bacterium]
MLKIGIIGLPNAGKSTLFNALIPKPKAAIGKHPFTTIEKNIGVVDVPDEMLFQLAKIEKINVVTPTRITFVDIAGLIKGAHQGEGLGNQFLHHIREVDLILHLVRFFHDENVPHVHIEVDPELNKGKLARDVQLTDNEKNIVKALNLLTTKKQLYIANIDFDDVKNPPKKLKDQEILSICAKLEVELSDLPWTEQQRFLKEYRLIKTVKDHILHETYKALDIVTFYTIAKRTEARAWTLKKGKTALDAAAKIHSDFASHFVKVEVIKSNELQHIGSWHNAHELGKISLHGKEYIVLDGDVLEFKVSLKEK